MSTFLFVVSIAGGMLGVIALLIVAGLFYRALRQRQRARALAIRTPDKIESGQFVHIGELEQWIQVRGEHRGNPILLILHGGPGIVFSAFTSRFRTWERDFTLVQWDQPGAGKTVSRNGQAGNDDLTIENMVRDGIQVVEWVLHHLQQRKLILFAASWGTILGTIMVKRRPDLFWAYVGSGQFVDAPSGEVMGYTLALERAQRLGDRNSLDALRAIGPPPYADPKTVGMERKAMGKVSPDTFPTTRDLMSAALFSLGYSLRDSLAFFRGIQTSVGKLLESIMTYDARQLGPIFETPLFFFQGALDLYTPAELVQEYAATLRAPHQEIVLWEHEGHLTFLSNPDMTLSELLARVRPWAVADASR